MDAGGYLQGLNSSGTTADAFIVKFSSSGVMQWSTVFGNTTPSNQSEDVIYGVACNSYNAVYVVGKTESNGTSNFPLQQQGSGYYVTGNIGPDGFIAAFDHYTDLIWSTSTENFTNFSVAIDHDDNIFTVGITDGNYFTESSTSTSAYLQSFGGNVDGTIMAFDLSSNLIWQTYLGDSDADYLVDCDISQYDENLYVGGFIESSTTNNSIGFPFKNPGSGYYDTYWNTTVSGTNKHGFFGQFDTDFDDVWITLFAGDGSDEVVAVNINEGGNLFVTGNNTWLSGGTDFPLYDAGSPFYYDYQSNVNYSEPYIAMLGTERDIEWCTYYGSENTSEFSTDLDVNERVLLWSGWAWNNNTLSTVTTLQENSNSWIQTANSSTNKADGMIAKFANSASYNLKGTVSTNFSSKATPNFSIFKNPVIGNVLLLKQINVTEDVGFLISVSDVLGRNIVVPALVESASIIKITLPFSIRNGIYHVHITGRNGSQSLKFSCISNF